MLIDFLDINIWGDPSGRRALINPNHITALIQMHGDRNPIEIHLVSGVKFITDDEDGGTLERMADAIVKGIDLK